MNKRDLFEGAVPSAEYFKTPANKPKLRDFTASKGGYTISVPQDQRRPVREQVIQGEILRYLRGRGIWAHKTKSANIVRGKKKGEALLVPTEVGVPDILACYEGAFLALEVKAAVNGKPVSGEQVAQLNWVMDAGGVAHVVWSIEQVESILDAMDHDIYLTMGDM